MFLMAFQSSMGPRKSRCDIPNGTTQGNPYPKSNFFPHLWLDLDCQLEEENTYKTNCNIYTTII
jgi:hypothetical protein